MRSRWNPEKSLNFTLGIVTQPFENVNLAVDVYQVDVEGQIARSTTFREGLYPGSGALVVAAGLGPQDGVSYFINAADTRSRGVEATLEGRLSLGDVAAACDGRSLRTTTRWKSAKVAATPDVLAAFNIPLFSTGSQTKLIYSAPRSRQILSLSWSKGVRSRRTCASRTMARSPAPERQRPAPRSSTTSVGSGSPTSAVDFDATRSRCGFTLGANNLFDVKATKLPQALLAARRDLCLREQRPDRRYRWLVFR